MNNIPRWVTPKQADQKELSEFTECLLSSARGQGKGRTGEQGKKQVADRARDMPSGTKSAAAIAAAHHTVAGIRSFEQLTSFLPTPPRLYQQLLPLSALARLCLHLREPLTVYLPQQIESSLRAGNRLDLFTSLFLRPSIGSGMKQLLSTRVHTQMVNGQLWGVSSQFSEKQNQ